MIVNTQQVTTAVSKSFEVVKQIDLQDLVVQDNRPKRTSSCGRCRSQRHAKTPLSSFQNHWTLAVINFRLKRLEYYDSLGSPFGDQRFEVRKWFAAATVHRGATILIYCKFRSS